MSNMKRSEFQRVIQQALDELLPRFRTLFTTSTSRSAGVQRFTNCGRRAFAAGPASSACTGVSLPHRTHGYSMVLPDRIIIYQRTHELHCRTEEEMVEQAKKTLLHEIGHYL
jgi:predicted Zn-dependent protease with MMP-like domain